MLFQQPPPRDNPDFLAAFRLSRIEDRGGMGGAGTVAPPTKFRSGAWAGAEVA